MLRRTKPEEGYGVECSVRKSSMCQGPEAGECSTHFLLVSREQREKATPEILVR